MVLERMIDNARVSEGLYFHEDGNNSTNLSSSSWNFVLVDNKDMLWHYRLGRPSLKLLLPQLFMNKSAFFLECETCKMAKHRRLSFSFQKYHATKPLIRSIMMFEDLLG